MKLLCLLLLLIATPVVATSITTCLDYTPFTINANGDKRWRGPNIETLHHITTQLSMELDASIRAPFARCLALLKTGEVDVVPGLIYTEERASYLHMLPYSIKNRLAVFYLKANASNFDPLKLTKNETIGMHRAFALPDKIKQSSLNNHLVPITTVDTGLKMALKGRIDGVLATIATGKAVINNWPEMKNQFTYTPLEPGKDMKIYLGISQQSHLSKQLNDIEKAIVILTTKSELKHLNIRQ